MVKWITRDVKRIPPMDHGNLDGLKDDDHTQYWNNTRGLIWALILG